MTEPTEQGSSLFHKCPKCQREFDTPAGVTMHTNRVHGNMGPGHNKITRSPQMVCTICDTSIHRGNMARHMLTHKIPTNGSKPVVASATIAPHASQQFTIKVDDEGVWLKVTSQELASIFGGDQWQTT